MHPWFMILSMAFTLVLFLCVSPITSSLGGKSDTNFLNKYEKLIKSIVLSNLPPSNMLDFDFIGVLKYIKAVSATLWMITSLAIFSTNNKKSNFCVLELLFVNNLAYETCTLCFLFLFRYCMLISNKEV